MAYILVENFNGGMDRRRAIDVSPPGTLWDIKNGHITRGGEIEKRKAFIATFALPANTFGLAALSGNLYVFGSVSPPTMPAGVTYQQLSAASGSAMAKVLDAKPFDGKLYVIAQYADGTVAHFYNGTRVTYWDSGTVTSGATSTADIAASIASLINPSVDYDASAASSVVTVTAATPGVPYTITASNTGSGTLTVTTTQANVASVAEVLAEGSFQITGGTASAGVNKVASVTVNGVTVTSGSVDWTTSNATTATAVAANIQAYGSTPDYDSTALGPTVNIKAKAGSGATPNGYIIVATVAGDVTVSATTNLSGGITAVAAVAQVSTITVAGAWTAGNSYTININGTIFGGSTNAYSLLPYGEKVYVAAGSIVRFCKLKDPTLWEPESSVPANTGAGFINISNNFYGSDILTALNIYQDKMAIFSRRAIQLWTMKANPSENSIWQTINSTGALSNNSVIGFSDADVFYLSDSGQRTLRARDASNAGITNDIGRPVDTVIVDYMATLTDTQIKASKSAVEPISGQYWLAMGSKIFVFSSYPGEGAGNIAAWSYYDHGSTVDEVISVSSRVYTRSGNTIYLYGGANNATYDASEMAVLLPFLDGKKPANAKQLEGFDMACKGTFNVKIYVNPLDDPDALSNYVDIGSITNSTYIQDDVGAIGETTHFAPYITSTYVGKATISNLAVHYDELSAA